MRNDIELLRIVSALGIVWFHSGITLFREASYAGLVFFVIVAAYFSAISSKPKKAYDRFSRLLVPLIFWSIIYSIFNIALSGHIYPEGINLVSAVLSSPSIHLWFLPFIFFVMIGIDQAKQYINRNTLGIFSGLAAASTLLSAPMWREIHYLQPFGQYAQAMPAVFIGLFLACYFDLSLIVRKFILGLILLSITVMVMLSQHGVGVPYFVGIIPCLLLLTSDLFKELKINITAISSLMMGVYCIHVIVLKILQHIHIEGFVLPIISFFASSIIIYISKKVLPSWLFRLMA